MNAEELRKNIEARGYEVRAIRVFQNSFHVTFWSSKYKAKAFFKKPIETVTWEQLEGEFPREA